MIEIQQIKVTKSEKPILIVDAYSLFIRHFVSNPTISAKGEYIGGIVGFLGSLQGIIAKTAPKSVIIVWEGGGSPRKRAIFSEYKNHRSPEKLNRFYDETDIPNTVDNRNWQISTIISLMRHVPAIQVYVDNCEADDVIGYLCKNKYANNPKIIISSDKDYYQLLDPKTIVYTPGRKLFISADVMMKEFNISPENFCLAKSICGDPSDNVPGLEGIGFKSLAKRFPELSLKTGVTIEEIVTKAKENCKQKGPKIFARISEGEEIIRKNWRLMYLDTNNLSASQISKVEHVINTFVPKPNKMNLMRQIIKDGIDTFDVDRFFFHFSFVSK